MLNSLLVWSWKGRLKEIIPSVCLVIGMLAIGSTGRADLVIIGVFSDPALKGDITALIPPHPMYYDNTKSAVYHINNSNDGTPSGQGAGSSIVWSD